MGKRWFHHSLFVVFAFVLLTVVTACGNSSNEAQTTEDGKIIVDFWYALGGNLGQSVEEMVDNFNNSQDDIQVNAVFQGSYEESLTQVRQLAGTSEAPALVQVFEVGTKYMIESGYTEPMQTFIDKDNFDLSLLEDNILSYYQVDGDLHSMPFNTSNSIMVYNKDMFKEAGLDPESPPRTFSEVREAAKVLNDHYNGQVDGFSVITHGWFTEQMIANQGGLFVDADNGRAGEPTQALINEEPGQRWFEWLADMKQDGTLGDYGREWDDHRAAFLAGTVAMYLDSTASLAGTVNNAEFEVGTAFMPTADGMDPHGVIVGGASIWMISDIPEEVQQAAWEFVKYTAQPEVQAKWAADTGYFPITKAAYDEDVLQQRYAEYPQFLTAVEQLQNTTLTPATQGALIGVFPEARERVVNAVESLHDGADPIEAINLANDEINRELENYRRANQ
ncbi:ABC transporter substrate-binding protein [Alkalihalobacillus sp. MEB130]|uniref:ABC transporter substrate-binding protein n=1 Tax=Alkalihalobacillus sp. MEB130 TaxID=2976704 RepID=UPI0028DE3F8B|nr:ABC transporter substrate-binding protein [Alkalihalobacillus sp. MEB130]MDT8862165.1 ABC transporter substrate-binding protein [Alkalihalobacillus sp. MEB130]